MTRTLFSLGVVLTAVLSTGTSLAQVAQGQRPIFTGTWQPAEPARNDVMFDNGLSWIPGNGQLTIDHRENRLTITRSMPDARMEPYLDINGQFFTTVVYRIFAPRGRAGGAGAGGQQDTGSWQGNELVIADSFSRRPLTITFSMDGERLKLVTVGTVSDTRKNTLTSFYTRVK